MRLLRGAIRICLIQVKVFSSQSAIFLISNGGECPMNAADVMTRDVVTVSPDDVVQDVAKLLLKHRISGVPVVDKLGKLVGIVSEGDLMRRAETDTDAHRSWWLRLFS
jgi:CBS domain-containing protein